MPHGFSVATLLFGPVHPEAGMLVHTFQKVPIFHGVLSSLILLVMVLVVRKSVLAKGDDFLPDDHLSLQNVFEGLMEIVTGIMEEIIGPHYRQYAPIILGLWFYILFANMFGLIPFFAPATDKASVTVSMAIVVFMTTHIYGIKAHGAGYIKHFLSPTWPPSIVLIAMAPIYLVIELIGHAARVLSLTIRLMANMMADHTVVSVFLMLLPPLVPAIFTGLGIIVCFLQAFIFAVLTTIYFALATEHEEHDEEEAHAH